MEAVLSFFATVAAAVVCCLICKWIDRGNRGNKCFPIL